MFLKHVLHSYLNKNTKVTVIDIMSHLLPILIILPKLLKLIKCHLFLLVIVKRKGKDMRKGKGICKGKGRQGLARVGKGWH